MKRMEPRCVVCSWPLRVVSHIVILNLRAPYRSIIFEVKSRFFWGQNWRLSPISIFLDFWYVFYTLYFSRIPQKTFLLQLVWGITIEWLDYIWDWFFKNMNWSADKCFALYRYSNNLFIKLRFWWKSYPVAIVIMVKKSLLFFV